MSARNRHSSPLLLQKCHQGGLEWGTPTPTNIKNDNNSVNIFSFKNSLYVTHNQAKAENTRYYLWLSKLNHKNGNFLVDKYLLLDMANQSEVSYPTTLVIDGVIHIVYTHDRNAIRHIAINEAFMQNAQACML